MSLPAALIGGASKTTSTATKVIGGAIGIIPFLLGVFIKTILEGERGMRTRFGRPITYRKDKRLRDGRYVKAGDVKVLEPGTYFAFPVLYSICIIDVKVQGIDLPPKTIENATGTQYLIEASLEWRRGETGMDLRRSELGVTNELEVVTNRVSSALLDVIRTIEGELPSSEVLSGLVVENCHDSIRSDCGLIVLRVRLTGCSRTAAEVNRGAIFELSRSIQAIQTYGENAQVIHLPVPVPMQ